MTGGIHGQCDNSGELLAVKGSMPMEGIGTALMDVIGSTTSTSSVATLVAVINPY